MTPKNAITVTGLLPADQMGITLPHEHVLIDFSVRYSPSPDEGELGQQPDPRDRWRLVRNPAGYRANLVGTSLESAVEEVGYFASAGGRTIVDLTPVGLGPDARGLQVVAERTGINIIASTGLYIDASLPDWALEASEAELVTRLVDDIETGGVEGVRRGAIGEIAVELGTEVELRAVRAAGQAQARTGAPVFMHVMSGILPTYRPMTEELIALYTSAGGDLTRLVLCHQDGSGDDIDYQRSLLDRGILLEYDTFGSEGVFAFGDTYIQLPTDSQRIAEISSLVEAGYESQLLISQDICYQSAKRSWGGWGFTHILEVLRPRFAAAGVDDVAFRRLVCDNPASVFAFV